jgi:uncharacterized FlgJ-related protein
MRNTETGPSPEQKKSASFAELEQKKEVTAEELIQTLQNYAEGGWAISARVVNSIIDRVELSPQDRAELRKIAGKGMDVQEENRLHSEEKTVKREQEEYRRVMVHAA